MVAATVPLAENEPKGLSICKNMTNVHISSRSISDIENTE